MSFASFIAEFGLTILFYVIVIALIIINRKKFDFEAKIIALYRTKIGLKLMKHWGEGASRFIKVLAVIGIVIGFAGMGFSIYMILDGFRNLLFVPGAPPTFAPVIPGARIPGLDIKVPLFGGLVALFISVVVHEFSHGLVAAAHKIRLKNTGFVMFGPLPGAFVEPDEKELRNASTGAQLAVYAAGPFSNILLTIVVIILFGFLPIFAGAGGVYSEKLDRFTEVTSIVNTANLRENLYEIHGLRLTTVVESSPAAIGGLSNQTFISSVNNVSIYDNMTLFADQLVSFGNLTPNQELWFGNENESWHVVTSQHPDNATKGWIGISYEFLSRKNPGAIEKYGTVGFYLLERYIEVIFWLILLSSGLGLANLLPLGPVDGGRMVLVTLERFLEKKNARLIWSKISLIVFVAVLILLFGPMIRGLLPF